MAEPLFHSRLASPLGELLLVGSPGVLRGLYMDLHKGQVQAAPGERRDEVFAEARDQLNQYFAGQRREFSLCFDGAGTPFQRKVWSALLDIPYGQTQSYGELARRIGQPTASRAVGLANGQNPLSIVVPCHRVIGANGSLTGYGGGLERKQWLLQHERGGQLDLI